MSKIILNMYLSTPFLRCPRKFAVSCWMMRRNEELPEKKRETREKKERNRKKEEPRLNRDSEIKRGQEREKEAFDGILDHPLTLFVPRLSERSSIALQTNKARFYRCLVAQAARKLGDEQLGKLNSGVINFLN